MAQAEDWGRGEESLVSALSEGIEIFHFCHHVHSFPTFCPHLSFFPFVLNIKFHLLTLITNQQPVSTTPYIASIFKSVDAYLCVCIHECL